MLDVRCFKSVETNIEHRTRNVELRMKSGHSRKDRVLCALSLRLKSERAFYIFEMQKLFEIVFENDDLLVINKPAGLVCHPTKGDEYSSLISRIRLHLGKNV